MAAASSHESAPAGVADPGLDEPFGPGFIKSLATPPSESAANSHDAKRAGFKDEDNTKLTPVGCVLTLFTVAVIFGVAIPIVRWRDPATGQALPRIIAIFSPLLIGAAVNGVATVLLRFIGVQVLVKQEKDAEKER